MSSTRAHTAATPTSITSSTTATAASPGEGGATKVAKVVETVDYQSSAGRQQQERKPVAVVHEYPTGGSDDESPADPPLKQD